MASTTRAVSALLLGGLTLLVIWWLRKGLSQSQSVILLFGAAVVLETLAFIFIYADDRLSAMAILALVPLAALTVRFLGYDRIIAAARRAGGA